MEDVTGSRGKRKFYIRVFKGIFEHRKKIKDALWLFLWYIDKTTREEDAEDGGKVGRVLGGKPILDSEIARELQCTKRTVCTWRRRLQQHGYIKAIRAPYGYSIRVLKSKKWSGKNREPHSAKSGEVSGSEKIMPTDSRVASQSDWHVPSQSGKQADDLIKRTQEKTEECDNTRTHQPAQPDGLVGRLALLFLSNTGKHLSFNGKQRMNIAALAHQNGQEDVTASFERWLKREPGMDGIKWPLAVFIREYANFSPERQKQIKRERREELARQFMEPFNERSCPHCGATKILTNEGNGYVSCGDCGIVIDAAESHDLHQIVYAARRKVQGGRGCL